MNRNKIKAYAPQARRDFIRAITDRAAMYGLTKENIEPVVERGDVAIIGGRPYLRTVAALRKRLQERIGHEGFDHVMEAIAYTWFNRLVAIRYMELHGYLEHGFRVLSHPEGGNTPQIVEHAEEVDLPGLKREAVIDLKLAGNRESELYRKLLIAQCNALHDAMLFLFERIDDETELLLPDNLLQTDSLVRKLVAGIDEEDWQEVEIIGWLYEAYISERYEQVIGKVVASADIPAATQRFTPKWIVRYLVQNTLGRLWLATYPQSPLKGQMKYYIEPAEQTPEVQEQLRAITPTSLNPEEITFLDPACGSAHILVEAYDLFKAIYQERGYRAKDIPRMILAKNLFGLEIDDRAAQLAAFALMMKAREDDRRIFERNVQPNVRSLIQTDDFDAEDIAAALNVRASKETPPPGTLFETEDNLFTRAASLATASTSIAHSDVTAIIDLFENAKTSGSLIQVPSVLTDRLTQIEQRCREVAENTSEIASRTAARFLPVIEQARLLIGQYDCVVANPPYMGNKFYNARLKVCVSKHYKDAKADLYACFIQRNLASANPNGFVGMVTIPNWMFLSSFEEMRMSLINHQTIDTFVHNGRGVFGSDYGSCAFSIRKVNISEYRGSYRRLFDKQGSVASNEELEDRFHHAQTHKPINSHFARLPGSPVAYWVSDAVRRAFQNYPPLGAIAPIKIGMRTGDNGRFLRRWPEIGWDLLARDCADSSEASNTGRRWFPFNKGGEYRKWFGNAEFVVNWQDNGAEIKADTRLKYPELGDNLGWKITSEESYFKKSITWSAVSSSYFGVRFLMPGSIFGTGGSCAFPGDNHYYSVGAFLCSCVSPILLRTLNPTLNINLEDVQALPFYVPMATKSAIEEVAQTCCRIATLDWNSFETSLGFNMPPVFQHKATSVRQSQANADAECIDRFRRMKESEQENNRLFIEAYGLQDELSPEVPDNQITLYRPNREEDIRRLISYAVGCMMGRFSLDEPGLIYAHGGNVGFDPARYKTFSADSDGIIPVTDMPWFADDVAQRFAGFLGVAWPRETLEENITFVADSLGPSKGEAPRDTIRHYVATGFYKHHLQTYKRRPIYWLFSSGKHRAFQCLVYLHRYHEGTLSRMRTEYVIPLQGMIAARMEHLAGDIAATTSTAQRKKLEKERETLLKQQTELHTFDEKLRHIADKKIALDLDDGVKVNYGKFGDLLAEVKAVTGGSEED